MSRRWPEQQRLIRQLREVLRREFGCQDAWVVVGRRYRLEVRVRGRQVILLEDAEEPFWARFYEPVERERVHLGERLIEVRQWRKSLEELASVLMPHWTQRVGPLPRALSRRPRASELPRWRKSSVPRLPE